MTTELKYDELLEWVQSLPPDYRGGAFKCPIEQYYKLALGEEVGVGPYKIYSAAGGVGDMPPWATAFVRQVDSLRGPIGVFRGYHEQSPQQWAQILLELEGRVISK